MNIEQKEGWEKMDFVWAMKGGQVEPSSGHSELQFRMG